MSYATDRARAPLPRPTDTITPRRGAPVIDAALARAASYLETALERAGGRLWRDYTDAQGRKGSNVWAAAFIAAHVGEVPETRALAARVTRALLEQRRPSGGWGYDEALLEDCDSTAWVLLAARSARVRVDRKQLIHGLRFILDHQRPGGGFVTYGPVGVELFGDIAQRDGWFTPQTCVSAAALAALATYAPRGLPASEQAVAYLLSARGEDRLWRPYWWHGFTYATYHAVRALRLAGQLERDPALACAIVQATSQRRCSDGGWSGATAGRVNGFATALAVLTLCEVIESSPDGSIETATPILHEALATLLSLERPGGGFAASAELLVPGGSSGGTMTMLDRGPFTTACIVHALDRLRAHL